MTREQTREYINVMQEQIKVMQAFVDGAEIEMELKDQGDWELNNYPAWNWQSCKYRIKRTLPEVGKWYDYFGQTYQYTGYFMDHHHFCGKSEKDGLMPYLFVSGTIDFSQFKQVEP